MGMSVKGAAVVALMLLAACSGGQGTNTAAYNTAHYEELSQIQWVDMTAAHTAAQVNNTSLIFMR